MDPMFNLDEEPGVDLTPLIDVIFMLLIFFIMTTTFSKPVLDVVLPSASSSKQAENKKEIIISIKKDGSLHYNREEIRLDDIAAILNQAPEAELNLYVDQKAPFDAFVSVVDVAKNLREGRFVISTEQAK